MDEMVLLRLTLAQGFALANEHVGKCEFRADTLRGIPGDSNPSCTSASCQEKSICTSPLIPESEPHRAKMSPVCSLKQGCLRGPGPISKNNRGFFGHKPLRFERCLIHSRKGHILQPHVRRGYFVLYLQNSGWEREVFFNDLSKQTKVQHRVVSALELPQPCAHTT